MVSGRLLAFVVRFQEVVGRKTFAGYLLANDPSGSSAAQYLSAQAKENRPRGPLYSDYASFLAADEHDPRPQRVLILQQAYAGLVESDPRDPLVLWWLGDSCAVAVRGSSPSKVLRSLGPHCFRLDGWRSMEHNPVEAVEIRQNAKKRLVSDNSQGPPGPHYLLHRVRLAMIDGREGEACALLAAGFGLANSPGSSFKPHSKSWLRKKPARLALSRILLGAIDRGCEQLARLIIEEAGFPAHRDDPILAEGLEKQRRDLTLPGSRSLHGLRWLRRRSPPWLACAIVRGRQGIVESLLGRPAGEGCRWMEMTPLLLAISCCLGGGETRMRTHLAIVAGLLERGHEDPLATMRLGGAVVSGLDLAAATGNLDLVMMILQRLERLKSLPAAYSLLLQSDLDVSIRLLKAGISPDQCTPVRRDTPLHRAAARGQADLLAVLLHFGAPIDRPNALGRTPLHEAARGPHREAIRYLISAGADCSIEDGVRGETALQLALRHGLSSEDLYDYFRELDPADKDEMAQLIQQVDAFHLDTPPRRRGRFLIERLSQWLHNPREDESFTRRLWSRFSVND